MAQALATELRAPLLVIDLARLAASGLPGTDQASLLTLAFSTARLQEAMLYLDGVDDVLGAGPAGCWPRLERELADHTGVTVLAADQAWRSTSGEPSGVLEVSLDRPGFTVRRQAWLAAIAAQDIPASPADAADLATSFRFGPDRIAQAVASAAQAARLADDQARPPRPGPCCSRPPAGRRADLSPLARRVDPRYEWDDLVLPPDSATQLREICQRVALRELVLGDWGFGAQALPRQGHRRAVRGTARHGQDDGGGGRGPRARARPVSRSTCPRWSASTSARPRRTCDRIFGAAADANAILFFDEADALFGKRSEVSDAHDRYANIEVLPAAEDGAVRGHGDPGHQPAAAPRRGLHPPAAFVVDFPFPADAERRRIWQLSLASAPLSAGVDLVRRPGLRLSGGGIQNAALRARYLAAGEGAEIGRRIWSPPSTVTPQDGPGPARACRLLAAEAS